MRAGGRSECRLLARLGLSGHVTGTTALPPRADIEAVRTSGMGLGLDQTTPRSPKTARWCTERGRASPRTLEVQRRGRGAAILRSLGAPLSAVDPSSGWLAPRAPNRAWARHAWRRLAADRRRGDLSRSLRSPRSRLDSDIP